MNASRTNLASAQTNAALMQESDSRFLKFAFAFSLALSFALLFASTSRAQSETVASNTNISGTITGRVVDENGEPLPNVPVGVYARGGRSARSFSADEKGEFRADNLAPAAYSINARLPGYVVENDQQSVDDEPRYFHPGESVTLRLIKGGVITGRVTDAEGKPIVAVGVRAVRTRDERGRRLQSGGYGLLRQTDDRGVYRIYGLPPGSYIVVAGGGDQFSGARPSAYDEDVPTYAPSNTRDGATEFVVRSGQETTADISYRGVRGHSVSGEIVGANLPDNYSFPVSLAALSDGQIVASSFVLTFSGNRNFEIKGAPDGEYELRAELFDRDGAGGATASQRITVRGADVTGVRLTLAPNATINGRIVLERMKDAEGKNLCAELPDASPREIIVRARRETKPTNDKNAANATNFMRAAPDAAANAKGEFSLSLASGNYRLQFALPGAHWFVRSLTRETETKASKQTVDFARSAFNVASGEKLSGVRVVVSDGAATVNGQMETNANGAALKTETLRVYLIPSEKERETDALRYAATRLRDDGTFAFAHLAPGKYWLLAKPAAAPENSRASPSSTFALDDATRARLRREAESNGAVIELSPCQIVSGVKLK